MLGVQFKTVKTKNSYTLEEFYEKIKDQGLSAGEPYLTKTGMTSLIAFPALDRQNQVQILPVGFKAPYTKWQVGKHEAAGLGNMVGNMALDAATKGVFGMFSIAGSNAKACEEQVKTTAKELEALDL